MGGGASKKDGNEEWGAPRLKGEDGLPIAGVAAARVPARHTGAGAIDFSKGKKRTGDGRIEDPRRFEMDPVQFPALDSMTIVYYRRGCRNGDHVGGGTATRWTFDKDNGNAFSIGSSAEAGLTIEGTDKRYMEPLHFQLEYDHTEHQVHICNLVEQDLVLIGGQPSHPETPQTCPINEKVRVPLSGFMVCVAGEFNITVVPFQSSEMMLECVDGMYWGQHFLLHSDLPTRVGRNPVQKEDAEDQEKDNLLTSGEKLQTITRLAKIAESRDNSEWQPDIFLVKQDLPDVQFEVLADQDTWLFMVRDVALAEEAKRAIKMNKIPHVPGTDFRPEDHCSTFTVGGYKPSERPFFLFHGAMLSCGAPTAKQSFKVKASTENAPKKHKPGLFDIPTIMRLQQFLNSQEVALEALGGKPIWVDGRVGEATTIALQVYLRQFSELKVPIISANAAMETAQFRRQSTLAVDGSLGPSTISHLQRLLAIHSDEDHLIEETGCWCDETVRALKSFLKEKGF